MTHLMAAEQVVKRPVTTSAYHLQVASTAGNLTLELLECLSILYNGVKPMDLSHFKNKLNEEDFELLTSTIERIKLDGHILNELQEIKLKIGQKGLYQRLKDKLGLPAAIASLVGFAIGLPTG